MFWPKREAESRQDDQFIKLHFNKTLVVSLQLSRQSKYNGFILQSSQNHQRGRISFQDICTKLDSEKQLSKNTID